MSWPFRVMVYDRALKPLYSLPLHGAPGRPGVEVIRVAPRLDEIGTASIDLPLDHPRGPVASRREARQDQIWPLASSGRRRRAGAIARAPLPQRP